MKILVCLLTLISAYTHAFEGSFTIPNQEPDLSFFSNFKIGDIEITPDHLSFTMPPELASAEAYKVKFERNNPGNNRLNSYFGSAHCLQYDRHTIKCEIIYNSLYQKVLVDNLYKTLNYITSNTDDIYVLSNRLFVAERFSGSPEGVLTIKI